MNERMSTVAVIPAHMASVRFPGKILFQLHGLPMIEHVRRRALMCGSLDRVVVATCDEEIASAIRSFGGDVVMTSDSHRNGTTRVAEAVSGIECTHVVLLQGDEPLLLPRHLEAMTEAMRANPAAVAFNATGPIEAPEELDRHSFVKCAITPSGRIMHCFRRSPCYSEAKVQQQFVRKILGIIAYRKDFLQRLTAYAPTPVEHAESIEQMRILENDHPLVSVPVVPSLPSVNEPHEADIVLEYIRGNAEQQALLEKVLRHEGRGR